MKFPFAEAASRITDPRSRDSFVRWSARNRINVYALLRGVSIWGSMRAR